MAPDPQATRDAMRAAELAARHSYGRLVAFLAARTRNIAAAEDALSDAFGAALASWPRQGVPDAPEAWLLTAARRALGKVQRHAAVRARAEPDLIASIEAAAEAASARADGLFPDERLRLMFPCTHPAIEPAARTPLMLQVVLGLPAQRIASAFLVSPASMGQRLVRAKARLADTSASFAVPDQQDLADRHSAVLEAIFAAFGTAWDSGSGEDPRRSDLEQEALFLADLLVGLLPDEPEPAGLLSMMLYAHARRAARRDAQGRYVPLGDQDPAHWDAAMIRRADGYLQRAAALNRFGRFQCEAAIQSVHAARARTGRTDLPALRTLYDAMSLLRPTPGVLIARAAVIAQDGHAAEALGALDAVAGPATASYQPYWAVRAHVLRLLGDRAGSVSAYARATGLTEDPAIRAWLQDRAADR